MGSKNKKKIDDLLTEKERNNPPEIDLGTYIPNSQDYILPKKGIYKKDLEMHSNSSERERHSRTLLKCLMTVFYTLMIVSSLLLVGYACIKGNEQIKQTELVINSITLLVLCISMMMSAVGKKEKRKKCFSFLSAFVMTGFIVFNLLSYFEVFHFPENATMKDFTGKTITEAMAWADAHHITVNQKYDNSEVFETYNIIKQDIYPNTLLKDVKEVTFIVSDGPDYEKEVSITDMTGWNIDDAVTVIEENFLNHVTIDFEENEEIARDIIISQSKKGNMKRSDELNFKVSIGNKNDLSDVEMIDLKNMTEFKALLWLKRNNIPFEITRKFSNTVARGKIISQDIKKGTTVNKNSTIHITISKGRKIIVPELSKMSSKEITNWVVKNRLKVEFEDQYDKDIKKGSVIKTNYKKGDEIEEGTLIHIVLSKGKLILPEFSNLQDFRNWANQYHILFREEYKQDANIEKGKIINFSAKIGDALDLNDEIIVYISSGSTIVIPNFVGQKKADIEKTCKNMHLQCTFYYAGTSSKDKDIALSQNKRAGSEVLQDTYVNIGLSTGKSTNNHTNNNINTNPIKPTPTSTPSTSPTPTPNNCKQKAIYLGAGGSVDQTKSIIQNQNPDFKFNFVTGDPGYGTNGSLYDNMFAKYHGKTFSTCDTITIYIVSR